jgi:hypothetical protein
VKFGSGFFQRFIANSSAPASVVALIQVAGLIPPALSKGGSGNEAHFVD